MSDGDINSELKCGPHILQSRRGIRSIYYKYDVHSYWELPWLLNIARCGVCQNICYIR